MNAINRHALNPPESPRAITVPNLRPVLNAVLRHHKREAWLSKAQAALAGRLVKEYDTLNLALQSDPKADGNRAFHEQQSAVGAGKVDGDVWTRSELETEARVRIQASRQRMIEITSEIVAMVAPVKAAAEALCLKMADDLEAQEREFSESIGVPFVQPSLTIGVLRDLPRRMAKLLPQPGTCSNIRMVLQPLFEADPVEIVQPHVARLGEKQEHARTLAQRVRDALGLQPAKRAAEINKANADKERCKAALAKAGVLKLGSGLPDPTWAALHGADAPLAPTADDAAPIATPSEGAPSIPKPPK